MIVTRAARGTPEPFDGAAETYDEWFERSAVTQAVRAVVHRSLLKYVHAGDHLLELNCGTGTDAKFLASNGIRVTASDASPSMIALARLKLSPEIAAGRVRCEVMGFDGIPSLQAPVFDGAFSNFGGLNCAEEPERVVRDVALRLRAGGIFIACLMNRYCVWEMMSFILRGKPGEARRRLRTGGTGVKVGRGTVRVTYHTPASFSRLLGEFFSVVECFGLNILSPGPNSRAFVREHPRITSFLLGADGLVRSLPPFAGLGDHFVVVARRKNS